MKPRVHWDNWAGLWRVSHQPTYTNLFGNLVPYSGRHTTWFRTWDDAIGFALGLVGGQR